jgi:hypothetical protein
MPRQTILCKVYINCSGANILSNKKMYPSLFSSLFPTGAPGSGGQLEGAGGLTAGADPKNPNDEGLADAAA